MACLPCQGTLKQSFEEQGNKLFHKSCWAVQNSASRPISKVINYTVDSCWATIPGQFQ